MPLSWGCGDLSARHLFARRGKQPVYRHTYSLRANAWRRTAAEANTAPNPAPRGGGDKALSRRLALLGLATASVSCTHAQCLPAVHAKEQQQDTPSTTLAGTDAFSTVDYSMPGPLAAAPFPELEHTCSRCFPACLGNRCMLRLDVVYPKNGKTQGDIASSHPCLISWHWKGTSYVMSFQSMTGTCSSICVMLMSWQYLLTVPFMPVQACCRHTLL